MGCENEEKQSSKPSGWAPSYPEDPKDAKKVVPKIKPSQKSLSNQDHRNNKQDDVEAAEESRIKTAQVVKTVTREVQEKSAGIYFLTNCICKDPAKDELDKMLSKKGSPTRRRKCSNMVSELTQSWKEMEKEKKQAQEGGEDNEDRSVQLGTNQEDTEYNRTNEYTESAVTIKRSSVLR